MFTSSHTGDRIVTVDAQSLEGRQLQAVIEPRDRHNFLVEKRGAKPLEQAFPDVARRMTLSDTPGLARGGKGQGRATVAGGSQHFIAE